MKISSKELIQSYIVTTAKYDFSVYEKRILYRIIEKIQFELEGESLKGQIIPQNLFGDRQMSIPVNQFLNGENDKNYARVKKALTDLRNKTIELEDDKQWRLIGIIEKPNIEKYEAIAHFEIDKDIYSALLNFAKGYRKYELQTAFEFDSAYSMRFYELFSEQKNPINYSIEKLKEMFGIPTKYENKPTNFIKYVVSVAKEELDKKSPYSFDFYPRKTARKITHIDFRPYKTKNQDPSLERKNLQKQASPRWILKPEIINSLKEKYGFTDREIKLHSDLFKEAQEKIDLLSLLSFKSAYCANRSNPIGTIITIIRKELNELDNE